MSDDYWGPADAEPGMGGMEDRALYPELAGPAPGTYPVEGRDILDAGTGLNAVLSLGGPAPEPTEDRVNPALVHFGAQAGKAALGGAAAGLIGSALGGGGAGDDYGTEERGIGGCILGHQAQEALKRR